MNRLENEAGRVVSEGALDLTAKQVSSAKGRIAAKGDLQVTVGTLEQQGGELASQGTLTLDADSLDNRNGGLVSADGGSPPRHARSITAVGKYPAWPRWLWLSGNNWTTGGQGDRRQ